MVEYYAQNSEVCLSAVQGALPVFGLWLGRGCGRTDSVPCPKNYTSRALCNYLALDKGSQNVLPIPGRRQNAQTTIVVV